MNVSVRTGELVFVPENASNPYDNEHADINGHGVQLYVRTRTAGGAWLSFRTSDQRTARARRIEGWGTSSSPARRGRGRATDSRSARASGCLRCRPVCLLGAYPVALDVLVNENGAGARAPARPARPERREGEFVYLRGDRHDPSRLVPLMIVG